MEHQPPKQGQQSGTPTRLEKIGNVWQAYKPGEDATLSSRVRHLATFFVVERYGGHARKRANTAPEPRVK